MRMRMNHRCHGWLLFFLLISIVLQGTKHPGETTAAQAKHIPVGATVEILDPNLALRSAPGLDNDVLAWMKLGTRAIVLAGPTWVDSIPWYQIRAKNYGSGWANGYYLWVLAYPVPSPTLAPAPATTKTCVSHHMTISTPRCHLMHSLRDIF